MDGCCLLKPAKLIKLQTWIVNAQVRSPTLSYYLDSFKGRIWGSVMFKDSYC